MIDAWRATDTRLDVRALLPVLLVWMVLALLPIGRVSELPLLVGAVWALLLLLRNGRQTLALPGVRLALLLFACYWLPALISALDAVAPAKTWNQVAGQLRFGLFAVFVAATVRTPAQWQWLLRASALLILLWLLDAWLQALTGHSLAGEMTSDRLSGIFGADNLKLGGVIAALSPWLLAWTQRGFGFTGTLLVGLLLAGVILLAGARAAWLVYAIVLMGWLWLNLLSGHPRRALSVIAGLLLLGGVLGYGAWLASPTFAERIDRTMLLVAGESDAVEHALSGRVSIWRTALAMAKAHPVNGVGVRGFRDDYADHAEADDRWMQGEQAAHPHQLVLELATETGVIGLSFWLLAAVLLFAVWRRAGPAIRAEAWVPMLALVAMTFPLNTHYAFYSSWWGLFFWWQLALAVAALHLQDTAQPGMATPAT